MNASLSLIGILFLIFVWLVPCTFSFTAGWNVSLFATLGSLESQQNHSSYLQE